MNRKQRRAGIFAAALEHHQAGRLAEAERAYRQVLAADPRHADSLHLLGVIASQVGRHDVAVAMIGQALAIDARAAAYHASLGNALTARGQAGEAIACYRRALDLRPDYPEAHSNLGVALAEQGRLEEAVACLRRAIDLRPGSPEAHGNLGNALQKLGRADEAIACYRRAIALRPGYPEAHANLGNALQEQGRLDEAIACYRRAIELRPGYPEAHSNLGLMLAKQRRFDEAAACHRRAIALRAGYPEAHTNLGVALMELKRLDEAAACHRRAIELRADYPEAYANLGLALQELGELDEAAACCRRAIELRPDLPEAHVNLGNALQIQRRLDEAMACYRRAIEIKANSPRAHVNLAMALLAMGDLAAGWVEYEWREKPAAMLKGGQPQWHGEAAEGRRLLIRAEQGFGDTLQFCRYAPLAAARGLAVILEVQKPLVRLLRGLAGVEQVVERGQALPDVDLHCPLLSLPLAMGTTLANIPAGAAYLHADALPVESWRNRLAAMGREGRRIGLAWAGNAVLPSDRRRSLAPERLAPLFEVPGVQFFSLQKDGPAAPARFPLTDFMAEMDDFADTAALVANLDLVISVDSAVAHLAAALGKPVWLLDRFDADWRWLMGRRDSPWYPTLRLYRQPAPGEWDCVIAEVVRDLRSGDGFVPGGIAAMPADDNWERSGP